VQISGLLVIVFLTFIRYSSFGQNSDQASVNFGRWLMGLNAVFNGFSHFLFIIALSMVFIPVFIGKLSIIRDIYASAFFRPLSRINFSAALIQGLALFLIFFCQEKHVYFDNKNLLFIYFALILNVYLVAFLVALFFEYPFRTLAKIIFSPPKRVIRLKNELAKELNTNVESFFEDDDCDEEQDQVLDQVLVEASDPTVEKLLGEQTARKPNHKRLTKIQESSEEFSDREQLNFKKPKHE